MKIIGVTIYDERYASRIVKFDYIRKYESPVIASVREQLFIKLVIPKDFSVITGGHDLTHLFYCLEFKLEL